MKHAVFALVVVVAMAAVVGITLSVAWAHDEHRQAERLAADLTNDHRQTGVDDALGGGSEWYVRCPTVDGGTDVDMAIDVDGGVGRYNFTDITVTNDAATCVRVGLDSRTDSTHGERVGVAPCSHGQTYPIHTRVARCQSEGAATVVHVTAGRP